MILIIGVLMMRGRLRGTSGPKNSLLAKVYLSLLDNVRQALHDLNNEVMVIRALSSVVETDTGTIMSEGKFRLVNYANRN